MLKNELAFIQRRKTAVPGLIIGVDVRLLASYMTITDLCGTFIRKKKKKTLNTNGFVVELSMDIRFSA